MADKKWREEFPDDYDCLVAEAHRLTRIQEQIDTAQIYTDSKALFTVASRYASHYARAKRDCGGLDYHDMIVLTQKLLTRDGLAPWILYKLDGGIDHILVDEAQDTSLAQWSIINALAQEFFVGESARTLRRTLFVVGDEKQSIFSFQGAAPEAFLKMRDYFSALAQGAGQELRIVDMNTSFRSAPAILRAVDQVFARDDVRRGVASQPMRHNPSAKRKASDAPKLGRVELWPLVPRLEKEKTAVMDEVPSSYAPDHDQETILSNQIADRLATLLATRTQFSGMDRPLQPRDMMILLSRRGRLADLLVRALKARDVPVTGVDRMRLLQQLPVMDVLALLRFAILPADDLNLAALLRSPLINLSEQRLMDIAAPRDGSLWQAIQDAAGQDSVVAAIRDYLLHWLGRADYETPFAMLSAILDGPCPASTISGRHALWSRLGEDALDPLNEILSAALAFSTKNSPSLQMFLHSLEIADSEIKREMEQGRGDDGGQVRIMTVHASKGLEAPVVVLANAAYTAGAQQMDRLIPCGDYPSLILRKPSGGAVLAAYDRAAERRAQEHRRLLYVALTRAAHLLIVAGCEPHRGQGQSWHGIADAQWRLMQDAPDALGPDQPLIVQDNGFDTGLTATPSLQQSASPTDLPAWLREKAMREAVTSVNNPSRLDPSAVAAPDAAFTRGRIIHRLLQSLPDCPHDQRGAVARAYLANPEHHLSAAAQADIAREVVQILDNPAYAPLFGVGSRAEVPIVGQIEGVAFSGQIDRLCVFEDTVWVVDYKTNRPPPATVDGIPDAYHRQMKSYRQLLRQIYPARAIRCFLLWTYAPKLMELPE